MAPKLTAVSKQKLSKVRKSESYVFRQKLSSEILWASSLVPKVV